MSLKAPSLLRFSTSMRQNVCFQCRHVHRVAESKLQVPPPLPFVPDPETFLKLIGRNMVQHAAKIPSWDALFTLNSAQLKESGIEPARARRYLLWWRDRYRTGRLGIGADLTEVENGVAELRIAEVPSERPMDSAATVSKSAGMRKFVVNVKPTGATRQEAVSKEGPAKPPMLASVAPALRLENRNVKPLQGMRIVDANVISGTGVEPVKGYQGVARLKATDGLWEERRGHKVDGGERRRAEVRYKRRLAEKKAAR